MNKFPPSLISIERCGASFLHVHAGHCIAICIRGRVELCYGEETANGQDCYLLETSGKKLRIKADSDDAQLYLLTLNSLHIVQALARADLADGLLPLRLSEQCRSILAHLLEVLHTQFHGKLAYYRETCDSLLLSVVYLLCRELADDRSLQNESDLPQRIKSYIDYNYYRDLSLNSIANEFYISTDHLSHIYKNTFQTSPINYLIDLRIIKAQTLLISTNETVNRISMMVGYENSNYFSTLFRKTVGKSPSEFRLNAKRNI